jgi:hypothetical protein
MLMCKLLIGRHQRSLIARKLRFTQCNTGSPAKSGRQALDGGLP